MIELGQKKKKKKKTCFTAGRTCQVGSVGRAGGFFYLFISGSKNDRKNTNI